VKTESDVWEPEGPYFGSNDSPRLFERLGMKPREAAAEENVGFWSLLSPLKTNLYNFILKSLNFAIDADDVYQETVLHGFQYIASFRRDADFRAWIFSIAHNEIKRHFRRSRMRIEAIVTNIPLISVPQEEKTLIQEIHSYASGLRPREREVFFLFYDSGFSISEIGEITNLKSGYIKLLLHQARAYLKTKLGVSHD
jgi:RNA polymerase sigma factor (sigma-70 family)